MQPRPEDRSSQTRGSDVPSTGEVRNAAGEPVADRRLFPYNSVVAVIDDAAHLEAAVDALLAGGFAEADVGILSGAAGVQRIDAKGERKGLLARLFRIVDRLGEEHEHTARHVDALEAGSFVVVVAVPDDAAKARAHAALATHGGHFINYYSHWQTEDLAP
jgi:hypothetical protein